jgi:hypothetical protein
MLVTFRSRAGLSITMFHDIAVELIRMMGASGRIPSALAADEVAEAAARLRAALQSLPSPEPVRSGPEDDDQDKEQANVVGLPTRAVPLLDLLDRAAAEHTDVLWEVKG